MLKSLLFVLLLIWSNSGVADCWYNGMWVPDGTRIGNLVCVGYRETSLFSASVKNWLWLFFGSGIAVGSALFLFRGARQSPQWRILSITLYGAAAILCTEVILTFIRFLAHY